MAKTDAKIRPTQNVAAWKRLLADVLREAPTRPTTATIAGGVSLIRESMGKRRVSPALVEKWRSEKSSLVPVDAEATTALVDALVDLGVFRPIKAAVVEQEQLLSLLGYRRSNTPGQLLHTVYRTSQNRLLTLLASASATIDDQEKGTAFACLASQYFAVQEMGRLGKGDHVIVFFRWDIGNTLESLQARNSAGAELTAGAMWSYKELQPKGATMHIVISDVSMLDSAADPTTTAAHATDELAATQRDRLVRELMKAAGNSSAALILWHRALGHVPAGVDDYWIHLRSDGASTGWRLVRHRELHRKLRSSSASTFCSSLGDDGYRTRLLATMGVHWDELAQQWLITPGRPLQPVSQQ